MPSPGSFLTVYKNAFVYPSKKYLSITSLQLLDTTLLLFFHLRQNSSRIFYSLSLDNSPLLSFSVSEMKVTQSCLTLCDSMDYIVLGILQARILERVAFPFSRGSSQPRD